MKKNIYALMLAIAAISVWACKENGRTTPETDNSISVETSETIRNNSFCMVEVSKDDYERSFEKAKKEIAR